MVLKSRRVRLVNSETIFTEQDPRACWVKMSRVSHGGGLLEQTLKEPWGWGCAFECLSQRLCCQQGRNQRRTQLRSWVLGSKLTWREGWDLGGPRRTRSVLQMRYEEVCETVRAGTSGQSESLLSWGPAYSETYCCVNEQTCIVERTLEENGRTVRGGWQWGARRMPTASHSRLGGTNERS